ncbi:hypothetical protein N7520_008897 [Penicillium odoratum]|uniref:uncharacterized protein n=1 Tax=Penicillium odoratum TaxID=1167516 RepID=UPI0025472C56|nr:uncharacterized protein N7520_008897 [Penicillium odoratum]KAJ5751980.1 hypothetical protein N7520_008897 [Penicillium odoratum]
MAWFRKYRDPHEEALPVNSQVGETKIGEQLSQKLQYTRFVGDETLSATRKSAAISLAEEGDDGIEKEMEEGKDDEMGEEQGNEMKESEDKDENAWILLLGIASLFIIYPYGNLRAIDAYFFGASSSTESGLNTVNINELKTYQQVYIYLIPILGNLGFINILVVVVRLRSPHLLRPRPSREASAEHDFKSNDRSDDTDDAVLDNDIKESKGNVIKEDYDRSPTYKDDEISPDTIQAEDNSNEEPTTATTSSSNFEQTIRFAADPRGEQGSSKALYIPPPWKRDRGSAIVEVDDPVNDGDSIKAISTRDDDPGLGSRSIRRRISTTLPSSTRPLEKVATVASMMFVIGGSTSRGHATSRERPALKPLSLPQLSSHATLGRNSNFGNLTTEDRERLGGIEYRALKLLLKIVTGYFVGLHLFGAICLVGWIWHANPKYRDYLAECGQGNTWWGFYTAQSTISNLGYTLTPDSMVSFQDATFPLIVLSFLAFAGNTCYPCLLRLVIWIMFKISPDNSSTKETLNFLLDHPRRCYPLLFPSRPTWILFGILFVLNFIDTLLILVLDLYNQSVNSLAGGPRVLAAIFQAANSRHTGMAIFNLADVNPAVKFSLVVMMYISAFPIAISVRASNVYEEKALGIYADDLDTNEDNGDHILYIIYRTS